jgi:hypothetical protein
LKINKGELLLDVEEEELACVLPKGIFKLYTIVIKPSSRFIFTTWVVAIEHLEFLLKVNNFKMIYSEEPPYWREEAVKGIRCHHQV